MTRKAGIVEIKTTSYEEAVFRSDWPPVNRKESCIHTCDMLGSHYLHEHQPKRVGVTTGLIKKPPTLASARDLAPYGSRARERTEGWQFGSGQSLRHHRRSARLWRRRQRSRRSVAPEPGSADLR